MLLRCCSSRRLKLYAVCRLHNADHVNFFDHFMARHFAEKIILVYFVPPTLDGPAEKDNLH
jgi:hypothetical protein